MNICPICIDNYSKLRSSSDNDRKFIIDCEICGRYAIEREAWEDFLDPQTGRGHKLSDVCRARLSHRILIANQNISRHVTTVTSDMVEDFISDGCPGPTQAEQAKNLIRYIGDVINEDGMTIGELPTNIFSIIGSPSPHLAVVLAGDLIHRGSITGNKGQFIGGVAYVDEVGLTLDGWEIYEAEKQGKFSGSFGFLAMQFGDSELEKFVKEVIKPTIKVGLDFDLVDMRDIARAGVIDNIMRAQIRDSAFVIVDLTHDNSGAYWEAGYAEGLGKPVIYICERSKFDEAQTHFDTNHCTTVIWSIDEPDHFKSELVATIRRSLDIFD